jgi:hypothetical protein
MIPVISLEGVGEIIPGPGYTLMSIGDGEFAFFLALADHPSRKTSA